jgi:hypothetical protein
VGTIVWIVKTPSCVGMGLMDMKVATLGVSWACTAPARSTKTGVTKEASIVKADDRE